MNHEAACEKEVIRLPKGGCFVSVQRKDCSVSRLASAANLFRVLDRLGSANDLLLITAFSGAVETAENIRRFSTMPSQIRGLMGTRAIEAYWLIGHWTDRCPSSGEETQSAPSANESNDRLEYSWVFRRTEGQSCREDWLVAATLCAQEQEQRAFIIRLHGETTLRASDGSVWECLESNQSIFRTWAALARLRAWGGCFTYHDVVTARHQERIEEERVLADASSYAVRGDAATHPIDFFLAVTGSISSKVYFSALGIADGLPLDPESRAPWSL